MNDCLESKGNDLSAPLLSPGSDEEPAAVDSAADAEVDDPTPKDVPQDPGTKAPAHRAAVSNNARQRRMLLERLQFRMRDVSRRVDGVSLDNNAISRYSEAMEGGRAIDDEDEDADGARTTDEDGGEDGGEEESGRVKVWNRAIMTAGVVALVVTLGAAVYLITLWDSLPTAMKFFVVATFEWLLCAILAVILWCSAGREEGEGPTHRAGDDATSARGRSSHVVAVVRAEDVLHLPGQISPHGRPGPQGSRRLLLLALLFAHLLVLSSLLLVMVRLPKRRPAPPALEAGAALPHRAADVGPLLHGRDAAPLSFGVASEHGDHHEPDALPRPGGVVLSRNLRGEEESIRERGDILAISDMLGLKPATLPRPGGAVLPPPFERGRGIRGDDEPIRRHEEEEVLAIADLLQQSAAGGRERRRLGEEGIAPSSEASMRTLMSGR